MLQVIFNIAGVGQITIQGRAPSHLIAALGDFRDGRGLDYRDFCVGDIVDDRGAVLGRMGGSGSIRSIDFDALAKIEYKESVRKNNPSITDEEATLQMEAGSLMDYIGVPSIKALENPMAAALLCYACDNDPKLAERAKEPTPPDILALIFERTN